MKRSVLTVLLCVWLLLPLLVACGGGEEEPIPTEPLATVPPLDQTPETEDPTDYVALTQMPFSELAESPAEEFAVTEEADGVTVTGYLGGAEKVRIPQTLNGKPVTGIASEAFAGKESIHVLYIPDSVTYFGGRILAGCKNIYALRTPLPSGEGKSYLGYLFGAASYETNNVQEMRELEFLQLGGSITELPAYSLYDCNDLVSVLLPQSVVSLGEFSLYRCESLKYINAEQLTSIGRYALSGCFSLSSLQLGAGLTSVGLGAMEDCRGLLSLTLPFAGGSATEHCYLGYLFGASDPAFSAGFYPPSLREITLLEGCAAIGDYAFYECDSLRRIILPQTVTSIGLRAFSGCIRLTEIALPNRLTTIRENAFFGCSSLQAVAFGSGLTKLGISAFSGCISLREITLPQNLTELPNSCFAGCTALQCVDLGGVSKVGLQAFRACSSLQSATAKETVKLEKGNESLEALLKQKS